MSDVFISYSRKDKDFVKVLHQALMESKYNAWVDWEDIPLTADWWEEIKAGIESADTFLFVISPDSIDSKVCNQELDHAVANHKRLIPIVRRDGFDTSLMRLALKQHNWLFFRDEDEFYAAFQSLVKTLDTDLDHVKRHTRLLVKAIEWEHQDHNPDLLMRGSELESTIQWLTQSSSKEPRSTELQLNYVNESRKAELTQRDAEIRRQKKARKAIASALVGVFISLVVAIGLGLFAFNKYQEATINEISALSSSSNALHTSNQGISALVDALKAVGQLKTATWSDTAIQNQVRLSLQQAVYDAREWNQLEGHRSYVENVSFSPDGKTLASASGDGTIRLWSLEGQLLKTIRDKGNFFSTVSFSPDGKAIASGGQPSGSGGAGAITVWDTNGKKLQVFSEPTNQVKSVSFSPDGKILATASSNGTVKLWTVNGQTLQTFAHNGSVNSVSFHPNGEIIASGDSDGTIQIHSIDGKELQILENQHDGVVRTVSFSPDGKTIASSGNDGIINLWSINGQLLKTFQGHSDPVTSVSFSPDGKTLVSGSGDKTVKLWTVDGQIMATFRGHSGWVKSVRFSPNGKTIASASEDGTVKLWRTDTQELNTLGHDEWVWSVSINSDNKIVSADAVGNISLWGAEGELLKTFKGHKSTIQSITFSPNGKMIASASWDSSVNLWNTNGQLLKTLKGHTGSVRSVAFSPDNQKLASGGTDKIINLWSVDGKLLKTFEGHSNEVFAVDFHPTGKMLASGGVDNTVRLWNINGQALKILRGHNDWVMDVSFSPNGKMLASASRDETIKLWNSDGYLIQTLKGHIGPVRSVSFSPDSKKLVSAGEDNTVRIWAVSPSSSSEESGQELKALRGHNSQVVSAVFSPDGRTIASTSNDKTVKLWNAETLAFDQLIAQGCHWLRNYLIIHPQVLNDVTTCQDREILKHASVALVVQGENLAHQGNTKEAIHVFETALRWNSELTLNPKEKAQQFAAQGQAEVLVDEAKELARADDIPGAVAKFQRAQALDPNLSIDPQSQALQTSANAFLERGFRLTGSGKIKDAIAAYNQAQKRDPTTISADFWNDLCWQGSLHGYAADVIYACEEAVALAPNDGNVRDSRGLARALTGNTKGAIEDFQVFVNRTNDHELKSQRQRWIDALHKGENPFNRKEIETLLN